MKILTFGKFDIIKNEKSILIDNASGVMASKKLWILFKFMLTHQNKNFTPEQLVDQLWMNESYADPRSTIRRQMHRLRQALGESGQEKSLNTIQFSNGYYKWHSDLKIEVDCIEFESLIKDAESALKLDDDTNALNHFLKALSFYSGDYLPDLIEEHWVFPVRNYYRRLYLKAALSAIEILNKQNDYDRIIKVCQEAIQIDTYEELFHIHYMNALNAKGSQKQALSHYEYITGFYYREMGIKPSEALRQLYKNLLKTLPNIDDMSNAISLIDAHTPIENAFYCEPEVFKSIFELERRRSERSGVKTSVAVLNIAFDSHWTIGQEKQFLNQLKIHLMTHLRKGDSFTAWNDNQIVVLLPTVDSEMMKQVIRRVLSGFQNHEKVQIEHISSLEEHLAPVHRL